MILDTESTGLYDGEIVDIAIINHLGKMLLNMLIKPSIVLPPEVTEIHGISEVMVADAPTFHEVYPTDAALKDKRVLIYNSAFDIKILNYCCRLHTLPILKLAERADCLMEWVAQWAGNWSYYHSYYRYVPLNGGHRALLRLHGYF
ncbi:3'-5' exonuclease [Microcoleus sp. Pol7_A1]|uniref:3'-5' exonuclease n=1 Tax=Microcoleus sp. Pol7_A1 TaxID=2818893 RepID=UPI002FCECD7F